MACRCIPHFTGIGGQVDLPHYIDLPFATSLGGDWRHLPYAARLKAPTARHRLCFVQPGSTHAEPLPTNEGYRRTVGLNGEHLCLE